MSHCCCLEKKIVTTNKAPKAVGPYSVAASAGQLVFTAGQLGLIPETGVMVEGGIQAQTRQALSNLAVVLEASGSDLDHVLKVTVFLHDIADFTAMNKIYAEFFKGDCPARSAVQVAALPKQGLVEIEAIGLIPCDCDCDCQSD
ncbi:MAG: RidA family protein [Anaerolineaceae bacterium]|nr:RidA family protein [Anaerolineaceae bacterium]